MKVRMLFDAHCHFRTGETLGKVVPLTAAYCRYAVAMGNTVPAIKTTDDAERYKAEILSAIPSDCRFDPIMTIMLTRQTTPEIIREAARQNVRVLKFIPKGVSTNSDESVALEDLPEYYPVLEAVRDCEIIFSGHWESLRDHRGVELHDIGREYAALPYLAHLVHMFPGLKIIAEHATTAGLIEYVRHCPVNVAATLTVHHATLTYQDVCDGTGRIVNPHYYCKPIAKREPDRIAVVNAMTSGDRHFFLGSDTAPHPMDAKMKTPPAAGIFSAPVVLSRLMQIFEEAGALDYLDGFASEFGTEFYGLPPIEETIEVERRYWKVPWEYGGIVPFMAGQLLRWQVAH